MCSLAQNSCVSAAGDENSREGCMRITSVYVHLQCVVSEYGVYHTLSSEYLPIRRDVYRVL